MATTRLPMSANIQARWNTKEVFPTPPLLLKNVSTGTLMGISERWQAPLFAPLETRRAGCRLRQALVAPRQSQIRIAAQSPLSSVRMRETDFDNQSPRDSRSSPASRFHRDRQ